MTTASRAGGSVGARIDELIASGEGRDRPRRLRRRQLAGRPRSSRRGRDRRGQLQRSRRADVLRLTGPAPRQPIEDRGLVPTPPGDRRPGGPRRVPRGGLPTHRIDRPLPPDRRGPCLPEPPHLGGDLAVPAARSVGRGRRGPGGCGPHGRRDGSGTYGRAPALDAAAVGDRSHGGPRPDGPRVHRAVVPRNRPRPDLRGVVPPVRHGTDVPLREASPEATPVEDPREGVAAQEPDAHPLPGGVREGLPGRALRPDPPRRVQGAAVGLGSVLHDAAGRQR